jgi:hypothetical protein
MTIPERDDALRSSGAMAPDSPGVESSACPVPGVSQTHALIDNIPYLLMLVLGAAICQVASAGGAWGWPAAVAYFAYGVAGAFWIMVFVCPYCHFFDTRLCPCGYGQIAARICAKRDGERFRVQFRKHIPVIVPLWFIPPIPGGIALAQNFSWPLLALLIAFAVNAFVVLPLISRVYGCAKCPQKDACPWMGGCKRT